MELLRLSQVLRFWTNLKKTDEGIQTILPSDIFKYYCACSVISYGIYFFSFQLFYHFYVVFVKLLVILLCERWCYKDKIPTYIYFRVLEMNV